MFDSIFDSIIILIPIALLIVRFLVQARGKSKRQPQPERPPIPVHFEDDIEEEPWVKIDEDVKETPQKPSVVKSNKSPLFPAVFEESYAGVRQAALPSMRTAFDTQPGPHGADSDSRGSLFGKPVAARKDSRPPVPQTKPDFFLNLSKLPPLKQAVIMAEVLGPPKALQ